MKRNLNIDTEQGMAAAVAWQTALVGKIKDGGTWIVPRSHSIYNINHKMKYARKISGDPEPSIERVFEAMGWRVGTR